MRYLFIIALLLTACGTVDIPNYQWTGGSAESLQLDDYTCQRDALAAQVANGAQFGAWSGGAIAASHGNAAKQETYYKCMLAHGWRTETPPPPRGMMAGFGAEPSK